MNTEIKCPKCGNVFTVNEAEYMALVEQIKNKEFDKAVKDKLEDVKEKALKQAEIERTNAISVKDKELANKDLEIERLKNEVKISRVNAILETEKSTAEKDRIITELSAQLELEKSKAIVERTQLVERHRAELKSKDEQIEYYKDFKMKLSTKLLGESLEQHCEIEFNKIRMTAFPNASFTKDNDAKDGTKGDYVYREYTADGVELLTIMFEMKNEADETATKHKNTDFLKKLDKDRTEKKCEYAVLVSMLEQDNEYYNSGIVDVSYLYDKMYVVRPQNFIQIISLLRGMAMKSISYKTELANMRNQEIDIVNFENKLLDFKDKFSNGVRLAGNNFEKAIAEIDNAIDKLTKAKKELESAEKHLNSSNKRLDGVTIKKLINGNKTLTDMYDEAWNNETINQADNEENEQDNNILLKATNKRCIIKNKEVKNESHITT